MKGTPAIYLGRIVNKEHFRTFVYGTKGEQKLVESWEAYEVAMQSGIWFATREDALESVAPVEEMEESEGDATPKPKPKPRSKQKPKPKPVKVEEIEEDDRVIPQDELDDMVFEVKD
jgi:outer membrane biosynthesis protein TonB